MFPDIILTTTTREDVGRLATWLSDPDVTSAWYGLGDDGAPLHIGYSPQETLKATDQE